MALAGFSPHGFEAIASVSSATALTVPAGARVALIQAITQNVRWRDDGTDPTGTVGMVIFAGQDPWLYAGNLDNIRFFEDAASATMTISYYG